MAGIEEKEEKLKKSKKTDKEVTGTLYKSLIGECQIKVNTTWQMLSNEPFEVYDAEIAKKLLEDKKIEVC